MHFDSRAATSCRCPQVANVARNALYRGLLLRDADDVPVPACFLLLAMQVLNHHVRVIEVGLLSASGCDELQVTRSGMQAQGVGSCSRYFLGGGLAVARSRAWARSSKR